ncbi:MAG: NAD-dependent epimerase/dehydratase [Candidatus Saganbacteria bacterium]|uniref:NAD-dependent epimerase/dehydratase n=1 Tax=Candidatus Saganbacteria bacterium TaxID=2575572 RepID=A0A833L515_UNCSA|nr:MAG: NAD-dependent epimerase/dehydratase [Candidatus Saganbacteria bacterium]
MGAKSLSNYLVPENASIKEAMRMIDYAGTRVVYVINGQEELAGAVSDSDIRRAILKGKDIKQSVKDILNTNPIVLEEKDLLNDAITKRKIKQLLRKMPDSRYILLLDNKNRPLKMVPTTIGHKSKSIKPMENNGKCVLVVGGAGYLGSILSRKLLLKGFKVRVLDILMYGKDPIEEILKQDGFELIEGDMRNISTLVKAIDGVDHVVNLAAIVGDPACTLKPEDAIETNFLANRALAEACKYNQINRFVYASTCSVYGTMESDEKLTEKSPLNPVSLYARSKIQAEEGILSLEDENFAPTILRMSTLYGYSHRMRFDLVVNTMTKTAMIDKKIFVHGGGKQWRPLLNVDDAAESYVKVLQAPFKKIKGQTYNVGSEEQNCRIVEIAQTVKDCVPDAELVMNGEANDSRNYFVSFNKIERILNFKAVKQLRNSIIRIMKAIEDKEFPNINDPKYYNVEVN